MENNNKKRWGRRVKATSIWAVLVTVAYYISVFKGVDMSGWLQYTQYMTYGLGFLVGTLTITDTVLGKRK